MVSIFDSSFLVVSLGEPVNDFESNSISPVGSDSMPWYKVMLCKLRNETKPVKHTGLEKARPSSQQF